MFAALPEIVRYSLGGTEEARVPWELGALNALARSNGEVVVATEEGIDTIVVAGFDGTSLAELWRMTWDAQALGRVTLAETDNRVFLLYNVRTLEPKVLLAEVGDGIVPSPIEVDEFLSIRGNGVSLGGERLGFCVAHSTGGGVTNAELLSVTIDGNADRLPLSDDGRAFASGCNILSTTDGLVAVWGTEDRGLYSALVENDGNSILREATLAGSWESATNGGVVSDGVHVFRGVFNTNDGLELTPIEPSSGLSRRHCTNAYPSGHYSIASGGTLVFADGSLFAAFATQDAVGAGHLTLTRFRPISF